MDREVQGTRGPIPGLAPCAELTEFYGFYQDSTIVGTSLETMTYNYAPSRGMLGHCIYFGAWLATSVLLPGLGRAQQSNVLSHGVGAGDTLNLGQRPSTESQRPVDSYEPSMSVATLVRPAGEPDKLTPLVTFGGNPDSRISVVGTAASYHWNEAALHLRESSQADTGAHQGNRTMHIVVGAVAGVLGGVLLGKSVDKGRAGCGQERSGAVCDWGSSLYEPVFGAIGAVVGGIVGALLPHD